MDNITHLLTGYLLAILFVHYFRLHAIRKKVIWTALIASIVPDLDLYLHFFGDGVYLLHHRGFNSPFFIILFSYLIYRIMSKTLKKAEKQHAKRLFDMSFLAYCVHVFLDFSGSWGDPLLYPFSLTRYYLDTNPIIDIYVLGPLILFFVLIRVFSKKELLIAQIVIIFIAVHFGFKAVLHSTAVQHAETNGFENAAAIPTFINPFEWNIIGGDEEHYHTATLNLQKRIYMSEKNYTKQHLARIYEHAQTNKELSRFMQWARFPYAEYNDGTLQVRDLRFGSRGGDRFTFVVD